MTGIGNQKLVKERGDIYVSGGYLNETIRGRNSDASEGQAYCN